MPTTSSRSRRFTKTVEKDIAAFAALTVYRVSIIPRSIRSDSLPRSCWRTLQSRADLPPSPTSFNKPLPPMLKATGYCSRCLQPGTIRIYTFKAIRIHTFKAPLQQCDRLCVRCAAIYRENPARCASCGASCSPSNSKGHTAECQICLDASRPTLFDACLICASTSRLRLCSNNNTRHFVCEFCDHPNNTDTNTSRATCVVCSQHLQNQHHAQQQTIPLFPSADELSIIKQFYANKRENWDDAFCIDFNSP